METENQSNALLKDELSWNHNLHQSRRFSEDIGDGKDGRIKVILERRKQSELSPVINVLHSNANMNNKDFEIEDILVKDTVDPERSYCNSLTAKTNFGTDDLSEGLSECVTNGNRDYVNANVSEGDAKRLSKLLDRLRNLRTEVSGSGGKADTSGVSKDWKITDNCRLTQIINLVEIEVEELSFDWKTAARLNSDKYSSLEKANQLLSEHLTNARVVQKCLRAELEYAQKQNQSLNDVIINFSNQLGLNSKDFSNSCNNAESEKLVPVINTCVVKEQSRDDSLKRSGESSSAFPSPTVFPQDNTCRFPCGQKVSESKTGGESVVENPVKDLKEVGGKFGPYNRRDEKIPRIGSQSSNVMVPRKLSSTNFRKREHDFDSIMNFVKARGTVVNSLNSQMEQYDADFQTLQEEIYEVAVEKVELHKAYEDLLEKHNCLLEERRNFDSLLRVVADQKQSTQDSIQNVLTTVINKLNALEEGEKNYFHRVTVFESAIKLLEEQAAEYSQEIAKLKAIIVAKEEEHEGIQSRLENQIQEYQAENDKMKLVLESREKEVKVVEDKLQEELEKAETAEKNLVGEKERLSNLLAEKEIALEKALTDLEDLEERNSKLRSTANDYQISNQKLVKDSQELNKTVELLETSKSQLKIHLKEQRARWSKRVKEAEEESRLTKENCRWLQNQIDHLNRQLLESHHRVKTYQEEKTSLAQQVMAAEEERKLVDRKLEELKSALQGDAKLREALMERNVALQGEIDRLRKAKVLGVSSGGGAFPGVNRIHGIADSTGADYSGNNQGMEPKGDSKRDSETPFSSTFYRREKGEEKVGKLSSLSYDGANSAISWRKRNLGNGGCVEGNFKENLPSNVYSLSRILNQPERFDCRQQTYTFVHEERE